VYDFKRSPLGIATTARAKRRRVSTTPCGKFEYAGLSVSSFDPI